MSANYTSQYSESGLEVSLSYDPTSSKLTALVITSEYHRKDVLTSAESDYVWSKSQSLWWEKREGKSPLANLARVYHSMIR